MLSIFGSKSKPPVPFSQPTGNMAEVLRKMELMDTAIKDKLGMYNKFMRELSGIIDGLDGTFNNIQSKIKGVSETTNRITYLEQQLQTTTNQNQQYETELIKLNTLLKTQLAEINKLFNNPEYSTKWGNLQKIVSEYRNLSLQGSTGEPSNIELTTYNPLQSSANNISPQSGDTPSGGPQSGDTQSGDTQSGGPQSGDTQSGGRKRRGKRATKKVMKGGWMSASQRNKINPRSSLSRPIKSRKAYKRSR